MIFAQRAYNEINKQFFLKKVQQKHRRKSAEQKPGLSYAVRQVQVYEGLSYHSIIGLQAFDRLRPVSLLLKLISQ